MTDDLQDPTRQAPGLPRWVKLFALAGALLAATFLLLHLAGLSPSGHSP